MNKRPFIDLLKTLSLFASCLQKQKVRSGMEYTRGWRGQGWEVGVISRVFPS